MENEDGLTVGRIDNFLPKKPDDVSKEVYSSLTKDK